MIGCMVFTRDRPMQLDAFMRSARQYAPYKVWLRPNDWMGEDFELCVRTFLTSYERVVFHTDDDVWFRTPDLLPEEMWDDFPGIVSLRLGLNCTFQHPTQREQTVPSASPWKWREADGDFGYPLSLNATIYRSEWLLSLLDFRFGNPTQLEAGLDARRDRLEVEWMAAPEHSCCVSLPHNVVSPDSKNPRGDNPEWQPDRLAELYAEGWRIDLDAMDFSDVRGAHQEIPLVLRKG